MCNILHMHMFSVLQSFSPVQCANVLSIHIISVTLSFLLDCLRLCVGSFTGSVSNRKEIPLILKNKMRWWWFNWIRSAVFVVLLWLSGAVPEELHCVRGRVQQHTHSSARESTLGLSETRLGVKFELCFRLLPCWLYKRSTTPHRH